MTTPLDRTIAPVLYAWVGLDEFDPAKGVGLKQAVFENTGLTALAFVENHLDRATRITTMMRKQARTYKRTIRLVKYVPVEVVEEVS